MINPSLGDFKTQTTKKVQKIQLHFEDTILNFKKFSMKFFPWIRTGQLKKILIKEKYHEKDQIINDKDIRLFYKNVELVEQKKNFFDYYKIEQGNTLVIMKNSNQQNIQNGVINPYQIFDKTPPEILSLLMNVQSGLNSGRKPKLAHEGTSGTYFLESNHKKVVAVYKPYDEEPYTPNNPRGYTGQLNGEGIRRGILSGQCATRQVAAYLLDSITNFHNVPATTYVEFYHPSFSYKSFCENNPICSMKQTNISATKTKHGSLQQFIQYTDVAGNLGSHQFEVDEVHKIGILDLRILNCDRNQANILVIKKLIADNSAKNGTKKQCRLIPIDHGLTFPANFEIYEYQIVWMSYKQSQKPFSQKSLEFIDQIDPKKDSQTLKQKLGFRQICLRNFRIAQIFLKRLAQKGFTLHQIGQFSYRLDDSDYESQQEEQKKDQLSDLQKLVKQAEIIYFVVKENGMKSTIEFQLGIIKLRKEENEGQEEGLKINSFQDKLQLKKTISKMKQETSLEKFRNENKHNQCKSKGRNISLPHLKQKTSTRIQKRSKIRKKKKQDTKKSTRQMNQKWDEVFFHYFEAVLDRFIEQKIKIKYKPAVIGRNRLMSDTIDL